jgi:hypothetical protein
MSLRLSRLLVVVVVLAFSAIGGSRLDPASAGTAIPVEVPGKTPGVNTGVGSGQVYALAKFGDTVLVGGNFTQANDFGSTIAQPRSYVLAFDADTGALKPSFAPVLNGMVNSMTKGPVDGTVIIGGVFTKVNGVSASRVAMLNVADGSLVRSFKAPSINGVVNAVGRSGNRLYVGGLFRTVGGIPHGGLAALDATTGALDPFMDVQLSQRHNDSGSGAQGTVGAKELDVSPDGTRVVVIGDFKKADGLARDQVVMIDTDGSSAVVSPTWATTRYSPYCFNWAYDSYVRDVKFSPDGSYFVLAASGGGTAGTLCDAVARFETDAASTSVQPTWVDFTGGDTLWGVDVTDSTVFVGGHNRWLNNSAGRDDAAQGAVARPGIAALSTQTGIPLDWNPGRNPRGESAYVFLATDNGVYFGSDTEYIGNYKYKRPRLGFFPYSGGHTEATDETAVLPAQIQIGAPGAASTSTSLVSRSFDGTTVGPASAADAGGIDWSQTRGAFWMGSDLYYGYTNGYLYKRSYNGVSFGPAAKVDPYHDPDWDGVDTGSGNTYDGAVPSVYGSLANVTGMTYVNNRVYYTLSTSSALYYRYFNADSGIMGSDQFTATGSINWKNANGLFASNGSLYWASKTTGALMKAPLVDGVPSGTGAVVATGDFRGRSMFLSPATANTPPTASFAYSCSDLDCTFDGAGSADSDGTVAGYSWSFGDGSATASGPQAAHSYSTAGSYDVTLTVTDNSGARVTRTQTVHASTPLASGISFVAANSAPGTSAAPTLTSPAGVGVGDTLVLYGSFASATPAAGTPSGWTKVAEKATSAMDSVLWTRTATEADTAGSTIKVPIAGTMKSTLTMAAYRGAGTITASDVASSADATLTTSHVSPTVTTTPGGWLLSYWADKSGTTTDWAEPAGVVKREETIGTSTGRITSMLGDSGTGVPTGTAGRLTATTDATSKGVSWSIALPGAG